MIYLPLKYLPDQTVVMETDIGCDVDDVGALAMLLDGAKKYGYRMGGVSLNRAAPRIVEGTKALLYARGFGDVPVATSIPTQESESSYLDAMAKYLPADADLSAPSAPEFYRELFASAADGSVTIVSTGFLQNLQAVWRENEALFERKVRACVIMGGSFLFKPDYREYNFNWEGHLAAASDFVEHYPGTVIYSGWEAGAAVWTDVSPKKDSRDPVPDAYGAFGSVPGNVPYGRESWDPVTADFAIHGECDRWRLSPNVRVWLEDGMTRFRECPDGPAAFMILAKEPEAVSRWISDAIMASVP